MFSGIIEAMGSLETIGRTGGRVRLRVDQGAWNCRLSPGESVSVDGVCLTVERQSGKSIEFSLSGETLSRTRFSKLYRGTRLNLERAMRADQLLGGHIVTGHVDGVAVVRKVKKLSDSTEVEFSIPSGFEPMLVSKGSVAINGVSLTVATLTKRAFSVALVPYSLRQTNLDNLTPGESVHFEADILGKYVINYLRALPIGRGASLERKSL